MSEAQGKGDRRGLISEAAAKLKLTVQRSARVLKRSDNQHATPPSPPPYDQQPSCALFRLPRELRDMIWTYTLHASTHSERAHFHIYDEIIDSCTYDAETDRYHRIHAPRTAVLRTCRAVYEDAVQILYDYTSFDLVVLAGLPRPYKVHDKEGRVKKLSDRYVLGKIGECTQLLERIRHATLIVQPGRKPDARKYERRLVRFTKALGGGNYLRSLSIQIIIGRTPQNMLSPEGIRAFTLATSALSTHLIAEPETPRHTTIMIGCVRNVVPTEFHAGLLKLQALAVASKAPRPDQMFQWDLIAHKCVCMKHGAYSESAMQAASGGPRQPMSGMEWVVLMVALPMFIPIMLVAEPMWTLKLAVAPVVLPVKKVVRRRRKGQRLFSW
ncbi:hypothetical protein B0A55_04607 [Friedmanniomyces simplex]|uniref:DUF7730 domain-containing protein n=1 Tax=Friedmanniomyces simplex TaxID=329884 RepID=A0A4U0XMT0_9PEZI|nr:hypothetical protein B0A55_04607 [Friedmanniomyces simplex]